MTVSKKVFLFLLLWSVAVLLLMSMDSPLHHLYLRADSAWFFMGGKAMMNGLRPYVDFTDSKGPLLWLIYGIGYLLSPRNYIGVYALSCLCYGGILYYNYKTAKILLGDERCSLLVALLMPWIYFLYWFHDEVRAEDFCNLPLSASLYFLIHLLYNKENQQYSVRRYGLMLGGGFMAIVLIKWNVAAMQALMITVALWYYIRREHHVIGPVKWLIAGMLVVGMPFIVYLAVMGSLRGFIQEYFINTMLTVSSKEDSLSTFRDDFLYSWGEPQNQILLLLICGGGWLGGRMLPYWRQLPWIIGIWFYLLATRHNLPHYYSICNLFLLFPLIYFVGLIKRPLKNSYLAVAIIAILGWGVFDNSREQSKLSCKLRWWNGVDSIYIAHSQRISQSLKSIDGIHKPRVLNLFCVEYGFTTEQECLPAGKHFAYQVGTTTAMEQEHVDLLKSGRADYVLVSWVKRCNEKGYNREVIESYGYQEVLRQDSVRGHELWENYEVIVYKKNSK